jgi:multiple sugar transport system substrate-binding protein
MKHRLVLALSLTALLGGSQGCGPKLAPGTIVLHVANWGAAKQGNEYDLLVDNLYHEFERQNPGVKIQEEPVPGEYVEKMALAYIAHAQPEIMMLDLSSSALFVNSKMVRDLSPMMKADPEFRREDFFPNVLDAARHGDAVYAVPLDFTPMVLYYNKRLFDKAGVPYPTPDWNFAKFEETAKRLTIPGKQYGYAFANWVPGWMMWLWNNNAAPFIPETHRATGALDAPASTEAVTFLSDIVKKGYSPSISQTAAAGVDLFANGEAAMTVSGHWSMVGYKNSPKGPDGKPKLTWDDLGVVALPHQTPTSQTVMYESGYAISANCKYPELAWKFIRYMTSAEVQRKYQSSGIAVCARRDIAEERGKGSPLEAAFLPIVPTCRPPYGAAVEGYEVVEEEMTKAMDSILQNGREPAAALHKAALAIDREFQK